MNISCCVSVLHKSAALIQFQIVLIWNLKTHWFLRVLVVQLVIAMHWLYSLLFSFPFFFKPFFFPLSSLSGALCESFRNLSCFPFLLTLSRFWIICLTGSLPTCRDLLCVAVFIILYIYFCPFRFGKILIMLYFHFFLINPLTAIRMPLDIPERTFPIGLFWCHDILLELALFVYYHAEQVSPNEHLWLAKLHFDTLLIRNLILEYKLFGREGVKQGPQAKKHHWRCW